MRILFIGCENVLLHAAAVAELVRDRIEREQHVIGLTSNGVSFAARWSKTGQLTIWHNEEDKEDG